MVTVSKVFPPDIREVAAALSMISKRIPLHQTFQWANRVEKGRTRPRPSPKYVPLYLTERTTGVNSTEVRPIGRIDLVRFLNHYVYLFVR